MLNYAYAVATIENGGTKRQRVNACLDQVYIPASRKSGMSSVHCAAHIDTDHLALILGNNVQKPSCS